MPLSDTIILKDHFLLVANNLDPRHLGSLRLVCKQLAEFIDPALRDKSLQEAISKYKRAVLLPNGAYRLHSPLGVHTVDIHTIPGMRSLVVEALLFRDPEDKSFVSMMHNGKKYIGRPWPLGTQERDFLETKDTRRVFSSNATVLQDLAGGVWISNLNTNACFNGDITLNTVLQLTLDRGDTPTFPGQYKLQIVFTPDGW